MSETIGPALHFVPVAMSALLWYGLHRFNKRQNWFRIGELIFWDAIILIIVFLLWLRVF